MSRNIFIFSLLFICLDIVSAESLTEVEVTSPVFSNSINETKYPVHIKQNEEISSIKKMLTKKCEKKFLNFWSIKLYFLKL